MNKTLVYLSLGGNIDNPAHNLHKALTALQRSSQIYDLKFSHFYLTAPVEVQASSDFVNVVCSLETTLSLNDLFKLTESIEIQLGKVPKPKIASRPIDIDLLFYGDQSYQTETLKIPHPRWKERLFVLYPLKDLISEISLREEEKIANYKIKDLIDKLTRETPQSVSLLEKNPFLH